MLGWPLFGSPNLLILICYIPRFFFMWKGPQMGPLGPEPHGMGPWKKKIKYIFSVEISHSLSFGGSGGGGGFRAWNQVLGVVKEKNYCFPGPLSLCSSRFTPFLNFFFAKTGKCRFYTSISDFFGFSQNINFTL